MLDNGQASIQTGDMQGRLLFGFHQNDRQGFGLHNLQGRCFVVALTGIDQSTCHIRGRRCHLQGQLFQLLRRPRKHCDQGGTMRLSRQTPKEGSPSQHFQQENSSTRGIPPWIPKKERGSTTKRCKKGCPQERYCLFRSNETVHCGCHSVWPWLRLDIL